MPSESKEDKVLQLILESSPLKEWHFEELVRESSATRAVVNKWVKKYVKEGLLKRIKQKGKFPHFTAGSNNLVYVSKKRFYALTKIYASGLVECLLSLQGPKMIILFGSLIKGDWYKDSDLDVFIYGDLPDLKLKAYEDKLHRKIEIHHFENKKELRDIKTGLIKNVIDGYVVKGHVQDLMKANI